MGQKKVLKVDSLNETEGVLRNEGVPTKKKVKKRRRNRYWAKHEQMLF